MNFLKPKITVTPTTVEEAIAPFRMVKDNLGIVLTKANDTKNEAARRIEDAKAYAAEVEKMESARASSASAEQDRAVKILQALSTILGED